ncbi:MAG: DNA repair protein RadC [Clostridia bacterium]|nr:DNA repair protein RadC [Clostridia bacterium]
MSITIKELPELERPYEKLELYGEKVLSNAELLAIIIKTGTKEETSVQLAQRLLKLNHTKTEDLSYLQSLTIEELMQIKGIGKVKAIQLKAVGELAVRMFQTSNYKKIIIKEPHDLARIVMSELKFEKNEKVKVVILNIKNEILKIKEIASGGTNFANVSMKDIMVEPIKMKAPKIILVHNHPSGDSTPSKQDIKYTEQLYEMAELLGIQLVDHLVIGNMNYTSIFSKMFS